MSNEDIAALKRDNLRMMAQLALLESRARQTWVYPQVAPGGEFVRIRVKSTANNKALGWGSGLRGAFYTATPIVTLAAAYNPAAEVAITDNGIAYAQNIDNGNAPCLITNAASILSFDLPNNNVFLAYRTIAIAAPAGAYVTAYEAYWA